MNVQLYAAFVAATTILMLIPGPNVALITAASVSRGRRLGLITVAGTCAAMAPQLAMVALGMSGVLGVAGRWFSILRWAGAVYLIWLGILAWRATPRDLARVGPQPGSARAVFLRGFVVSLTNPKILIFYAAFFPQFVTTDHPTRQLWLLAATFFLLAAVIDCGWALLAASARPLLDRRPRLLSRLSGAALIAAGAGLAAARRGG